MLQQNYSNNNHVECKTKTNIDTSLTQPELQLAFSSIRAGALGGTRTNRQETTLENLNQ